MDKIVELRQARAKVIAEQRGMYDKAIAEKRGFNDEEKGEEERREAAIDSYDRKIAEAESESRRAGITLPTDPWLSPYYRGTEGADMRGGAPVFETADGQQIRGLRSNEPLPSEPQGETRLRADRFLLGAASGRWEGAEAERRALAEGSLGSGGYAVPSEVSSQIIDLARAKAVCMKAGAITLPMSSSSLRIARLASDPTTAWKVENSAHTSADVTFEGVDLAAKVLIASIKMSVELAEDSAGVGAAIQNALAQSLAGELDRVALVGSGVDAEPAGILGASGVQEVTVAQTTLGSYSKIVQAGQMILAANGDLSACSMIHDPSVWGMFERLVDGEQRPLPAPAAITGMAKYTTSQIPVDLGDGGDETAIFLGDFSQLVFGMRTALTIEVSRTASDASQDYPSAFSNLQVWIRAYLRGDVGLLRPSHFATITGIIPAAVV